MKLIFAITMELGQDVAFCPGADEKFLAAELCAFATRMAGFYTASKEQAPDVSVSWTDEDVQAALQIARHPAKGQP